MFDVDDAPLWQRVSGMGLDPSRTSQTHRAPNKHFGVTKTRGDETTARRCLRFLFTMNLIQRARDTGTCPPSLLTEERVVNDDGFETAVFELMEPTMPGTYFSVGFLRGVLDAPLAIVLCFLTLDSHNVVFAADACHRNVSWYR